MVNGYSNCKHLLTCCIDIFRKLEIHWNERSKAAPDSTVKLIRLLNSRFVVRMDQSKVGQFDREVTLTTSTLENVSDQDLNGLLDSALETVEQEMASRLIPPLGTGSKGGDPDADNADEEDAEGEEDPPS